MLKLQKHLFSLDDDIIYLNCAYMSPVSKQVEAAGLTGIQSKRSPQRIKPPHFFEAADQVRHRFSTLINAEAQSIAITPSASYGIATVAHNTPIAASQNIVVLSEQFPSNIYSWKRLAEQNGASLRIVEPPSVSKRRSEQWNQRILERIDTQTAVVAMPHVHWADGTLFDLEKIGKRARDVGAAFIIDGTQSVGALPFNIQTIQPDALICAAYKWLLGPYGIGVAYYGPRYADGVPLEENWISRKDSEHFGGLVKYKEEYQPGVVRFDVGGRSNFITLAMLDAALKHIEEWGVQAIQEYCSALTEESVYTLRNEGFWIEEAEGRASHLFGIRVREDIAMERMIEAIHAARISVSIRGNAVRISPHIYNTREEMDVLTEILLKQAQKASMPL